RRRGAPWRRFLCHRAVLPAAAESRRAAGARGELIRRQALAMHAGDHVVVAARREVAFEKECLHLALPLDFHRLARLEAELVAEKLAGSRRHGDPLDLAIFFHAARGVHGVSPDVVDELVPADDPGDERAAIDADA